MGVKIYSDSAGTVELVAQDNANNAVVTIPNPTGGGDTELITAASLNVSKVIDTGGIADSAVETLQINDGAVTDAKIDGMAASKLTGALPAIDGAALTNLPAGGLGGILNIKAEANTTAQTGTFVPSGDFIMVTGCGAGGTGTSISGGESTAKGPGGGSGGGVFQAKVYVTAGATYNVSVPGRVESLSSGANAGADGGDTTITLNGGSVILTLGGGNGAPSTQITGAVGTGGTVTATEGTTTGTIDAGAVTITGASGRPGSTNSSLGGHTGGSGIFGSKDTYSNTVSTTVGEFTGNQFGRGSDGTRASARNSVGGFITILY